MRRAIFILLLGLNFTLVAKAETPRSPATHDPELIQLRDLLSAALSGGNIKGLLTNLNTNVVVIWHGSEVCVGLEEVKACYEKLFKGARPFFQKATVQPEILGVHAYGEGLVCWGDVNDDAILGNGSALRLHSRFTAFLRRVENRWTVASLHLSANVFENPMLSAATKRVAVFGGLLAGVLGLAVGFNFGRSWGKR